MAKPFPVYPDATAALRAWVSTAGDAGALQQVPGSMLAALYPHLHTFGPRGDVYVSQLQAIETLLDRIEWNLAGDEFVTAMHTMGEQLEDLIYRHGLNHLVWEMVASQHYRNEFDFIMEPTDPDDSPANPTYPISNHPVFDRDDLGVMTFLYALEQFSVVSLYKLAFLHLRDNHPGADTATERERLRRQVNATLKTFNTFCAEWDIPA